MRLSVRPNVRALPQNLLMGGLWLLALGLAAWVAANWYWRLQGNTALSGIATPVSDPAAAAQDIASRQLFGVPAPVVQNTPAAPTSNFVVIGVATQWGKLPGFAVIRDGESPARSFLEGEEIAPGVKLVRVLADGIEIDRGGSREQLRLSLAPRQGGDANAPTRNLVPGPAVSAPAGDN